MSDTSNLSSAQKALELYAQAVAELELAKADAESAVAAVIPPNVQVAIDLEKAAQSAKLEPLEARVAQLVTVAKDTTLICEGTVNASGYMAVYSKGRASWHSDGLVKLAEQLPAILAMRKDGKPSVAIRREG